MLKKYLSVFGDVFKKKDTRKGILFILMILVLYRIGSVITVPGIDPVAVQLMNLGSSVFSIMNLIGGGALQNFSLFALGVGPYITSSIIIELLSDVIPALEDMKENGNDGRKKMNKIVQYLGCVLAFVQGYSMAYGFDRQYGILVNPGVLSYLFIAIVFTAGTMLLVWLGNQITRTGLANGVSLIIFSGIVSNIPEQFREAFSIIFNNAPKPVIGGVIFALYVIMYLLIVLAVVFMEKSERHIPVKYTKNTGYMSGTDVTYIPFKLNSASVIPVIFAQSVISAPQIIISFFSSSLYQKLSNFLSFTKPFGLCLYIVLVIFFTFFYVDTQYNPKDIADNLKKSGGFIPGIRPGQETVVYLDKILKRNTTVGAIALAILAAIPYLLTMFTKLTYSTALGGTGVILIVGIALETVKIWQGKVLNKNYSTIFSGNKGGLR